MLFTIQEFSKKTGLPPSKLRFYDKKGVLMPSTRLENGYRAYSADQIHLAKMIDSLRQADISIEDTSTIQRRMSRIGKRCSKDGKRIWTKKWKSSWLQENM
ncbi:MerR family transcriptional regulator [Bacillus litorisediminis]|uniref:MerR family transcriptional regulator n=1 Tax=Bacillus litorisediminis TaxID=2922713 RepID=UPI001FAEFFC5|nr:MerR family transcriptional regulator [Bacillus litorisediminis]